MMMVGVPAYGGSIKTGCVQSLLALHAELTRDGAKVASAFIDNADIVAARNTLAFAALSQEASHLLLVDAEMEFRADAVARLMAIGAPVIGCVYPRRSDDGGFVVWHDRATTLSVSNGIAEVDGIGMGCA